MSLIFFLITAIITGQLTGRERQRAREARQREKEAVVLYDVARLLSDPDLDRALHDVAERLRRELRLAAVIVEVEGGSELTVRATVGELEARRLASQGRHAPLRVLSEGSEPRWTRVVLPSKGSRGTRERDDVYIVPVPAREGRVGELLLLSSPGERDFDAASNRLLSAVATQIGLAVERYRLRREATDAEVLRRADDLKTALIHAVSHELKTPLSSIIASAGSLQQRDVRWSDEARQEFAEAIEQEARRLNLIVGNLLDLSRMEAGSLRADKSWHDVSVLIDDVLARLRSVTERHRVSTSVPEDLPPVPLDYVQIDQVLSNLIENAARYTPPGTEIRIAARLIGSELRVEVEDRGIGIPRESLTRVFDAFYCVPGSGRQSRGVGLGLAVAKGLVEAHGGRIWAENVDGGGARFVFTLPLSVPAEPATSTTGGVR